MKTFQYLGCKAYPHERMHTSKRIIKNMDLSLATPEKIKTSRIARDYKLPKVNH